MSKNECDSCGYNSELYEKQVQKNGDKMYKRGYCDSKLDMAEKYRGKLMGLFFGFGLKSVIKELNDTVFNYPHWRNDI